MAVNSPLIANFALNPNCFTEIVANFNGFCKNPILLPKSVTVAPFAFMSLLNLLLTTLERLNCLKYPFMLGSLSKSPNILVCWPANFDSASAVCIVPEPAVLCPPNFISSLF